MSQRKWNEKAERGEFAAPEREASPPPPETGTERWNRKAERGEFASRSSGQTTPTQDATSEEAYRLTDFGVLTLAAEMIEATGTARAFPPRLRAIAESLRPKDAEESPVSPPAATTRTQDEGRGILPPGATLEIGPPEHYARAQRHPGASASSVEARASLLPARSLPADDTAGCAGAVATEQSNTASPSATPAPDWNMPNVDGFPTDGSERFDTSPPAPAETPTPYTAEELDELRQHLSGDHPFEPWLHRLLATAKAGLEAREELARLKGFQWTCQRCGAQHLSTDAQHCPCEIGGPDV